MGTRQACGCSARHAVETLESGRCCAPACPARRKRWGGCRRVVLRLVVTWLISGLAVFARPILRWLVDWLGRDGGTNGTPLPSAGGTRRATGAKQTVPGTIYRRPDPMIYDQYFLQSQGFAVTWDNPDIHLERPVGTRVSSHDLLPSTAYHVVSRIWNLSETAAAPRLPVRVSYLRFGIGGGKTAFAETQVDLHVKGSPQLPARAEVLWTTPSDPGHYCLQVELMWPEAEDENPNNNLGQLNTDVKALKSPATFLVPVRNDDLQYARDIRLLVDAYQLPPHEPCAPDDAVLAGAAGRGIRAQRAVSRHDPALFPVPTGWQVQVIPSELTLEPGREEQVKVIVSAPAGFVGRQTFNVNAFDRARLLGGVTLYVDGN